VAIKKRGMKFLCFSFLKCNTFNLVIYHHHTVAAVVVAEAEYAHLRRNRQLLY
jgi:hypothetical protein